MYDKILHRRLLQSFLWTLALHTFPLSLFTILTNFDPVHPVTWLVNSASTVVNIGTWVTFLPLQCFLFGLAYVFSEDLKQPPELLSSRFKVLCSLFTKNNMLKLCLYVSVGVVLPISYLSLINESLLVSYSENPDKCFLNENNIFIVSCVIWIALYYFIWYDLVTEKCLEFPIIRQLRFLQIKSKFKNVFGRCFKLSIIPVFYFFIIYFWYQNKFICFWEAVSATYLDKPMCLSDMLSFTLIFRTWLLSSVLFVVLETLKLMIQIHFTEHYSFTIHPDLDTFTLSSALGEAKIPIIQHLACYDLYILSMCQKANRWEVFTLSQPGGHPHTWNAILCESLKIINNFINEVQDTFATPEPVKPQPQVPRHYHVRDMTLRHEEIFSGPVPLSPTNKIRNLIENPQVSFMPPQPSALDEYWDKLVCACNRFQHNAVFNYIFGSKPDAKVRFLVSHSQPLIWIVQSLSELSANALMEDQFGIVLKDLPLIINTLLRLRCLLEKLGCFQKKFQKKNHEVFMKASLKSAVKRSLYRIAIAYSDYLTELPLPPENLNIMRNFVHFKEC